MSWKGYTLTLRHNSYLKYSGQFDDLKSLVEDFNSKMEKEFKQKRKDSNVNSSRANFSHDEIVEEKAKFDQEKFFDS